MKRTGLGLVDAGFAPQIDADLGPEKKCTCTPSLSKVLHESMAKTKDLMSMSNANCKCHSR
jgi:hypothetical protein